MNDYGLLQDINNTVFIEAGSGTGQLSLELANFLTPEKNIIQYQNKLQQLNENSLEVSTNNNTTQRKKCNSLPQESQFNKEKKNIFLIDLIQGLKYKWDRYFSLTDYNCLRVVSDLRYIQLDILLKKYNFIYNISHLIISPKNEQQEQLQHHITSNKIVNYDKITILGKHLCGAATDIVLSYNNIHAFSLALCCHAKSDGQLYVGKENLKLLIQDTYNQLSQNEHKQLFSQLLTTQSQFDQFIYILHKCSMYQHSFGQQIRDDQLEKKQLGFVCRQLLDLGRYLYLQSRGYTVQIIKYCEQQFSGECWLLMAKKK